MTPPGSTPALLPLIRAAAVPLLGLGFIALILFFFRGVLLPFILGLAVVYIIEPVVTGLEERGAFGLRLPRWASVVSIYAVLLAAIISFGVWVIPTLSAEMTRMVKEVPSQLIELRERLPGYGNSLARLFEEQNTQDQGILAEGLAPAGEGAQLKAPASPAAPPAAFTIQKLKDNRWAVHVGQVDIQAREVAHGYEIELREVSPLMNKDEPFDLGEVVDRELEALGQSSGQLIGSAVVLAQSVAQGVAGGLVALVLTFMVAAFISIDLKQIMSYVRAFVPEGRLAAYDDLLHRLDQRLSGVVRGQLVICLLNGFLTWVVLFVLDMRFIAILTMIATVFTLIPIFGTIISSIPAVAIALIDGGIQKALLVVAGVLFIHFLEANFFNPKIMGTAARLHPALIIFALLSGEHTFGLMGALLAVPTMAVVVTFFQFAMDRLWLAPMKAGLEPEPPPAAEG